MEEKNKSTSESIREFVTFIFLTIIIILPIRFYVAQPFIVSGDSMLPTFKDGQYLIVDELSYKISEPNRGDVVIFRYPGDTSKFFIKRIIGLPNETVEISAGKVYVTLSSGETYELEENYVVFPKEDYVEYETGKDEYFVMGDNREASLDSRSWGVLGKDFMVGRAFVRLLPIESLDILPGKINFNYE